MRQLEGDSGFSKLQIDIIALSRFSHSESFPGLAISRKTTELAI